MRVHLPVGICDLALTKVGLVRNEKQDMVIEPASQPASQHLQSAIWEKEPADADSIPTEAGTHPPRHRRIPSLIEWSFEGGAVV